MKKILSSLITGSKLGALMCFSLMGFFSMPTSAEGDIPPCHQMKAHTSATEIITPQSKNCNACELSQKVWSNPLIEVASNFYTKLFKQTQHECPFLGNEEPNCKHHKRFAATKDPPDTTDCLCRQLVEKNSVQLRL